MSESGSVESNLSSEAKLLMSRVKERYLGSRDFNGLAVKGRDFELKVAAEELLEARLIQVVTDEDWMNPHIMPWPVRRSFESQLLDIKELTEDDPYGFCLYPTALAMEKEDLSKRYDGQPFHVAMARGKGTLEIAYFEFEVLEGYRNDSRFALNFGDTGASIYVNAEEEHHGLEDHTVYLEHIGYGYDLSEYDSEDPNSPIIRRVAVFYGDLINLDPIYQRRWESYQVDPKGVKAHPSWWGSQMGHWDTAMGPFDRLFAEMDNINELSTLIFGLPLFRSTERSETLSWILRPTQREWEDFALQMDKALSENMDIEFFNRIGTPSFNEQGHHLMSLARLELFLQERGETKEVASQILKPLKLVRKLRQKPAHAVTKNMTDKAFIHRQIDLMLEVNRSIAHISYILSQDAKCSEWEDKWARYGNWIF